MTLTLPQTVVLLALSRGEQLWIPPITRRALLREQFIEPAGSTPAPTERRRVKYKRRPYVITDSGRRALTASPHRESAETWLTKPESRRCAP